jgi:lipopolysaccharide export system ATP-binding protein
MESLIDEFGLEHIRTNECWLSGGERRRTEIARCLATDPNLSCWRTVCWCRPCCVEDTTNCSAIKTKNIGILITDHNVQETLAITDKTYLDVWRWYIERVPEELVEDEMVQGVFRTEFWIEKRKWNSKNEQL